MSSRALCASSPVPLPHLNRAPLTLRIELPRLHCAFTHFYGFGCPFLRTWGSPIRVKTCCRTRCWSGTRSGWARSSRACAAGETVSDGNLARISPLAYAHVMPNGTYVFDRSQRRGNIAANTLS